MNARSRRVVWVGSGVAAVALACALVLNAFRANVVFFVTPSQIAAHAMPSTRHFRLGGLVERGSLRRERDGLTVHFIVTDTATAIPVVYRGLLPDLFREGSGVVAQGWLDGVGQFHADQVLAKHDEKYQPPELGAPLHEARDGAAAVPATLHAAAGPAVGGTAP
ncbi:cytochrome c maturation protein CcmE [Paraburkholderia sp. DHOC27]|uniref:cytochrome c maturation protein CcmE n=1 Tax=Paraburkholderia sp. DHOC27 TaxID=2303330 RepID=UPI000E3D64D8|nr:cytochrome c maturation protein CcmE [Paraburkholderia sp. DHOC27]RFU49014.1 cytochrome c maturation protein CcmE [Paraburkholderia sp. DHOC27]